MNKKRVHSYAPTRKSTEGRFSNDEHTDGRNYRSTKIGEHEVRVWNAQTQKGISHEIISALRSAIKRVGQCKPIALMADHHPGESGVIGSVIASNEFVVPDLIGGDCGCGVLAARTSLSASAEFREALPQIYRELCRRIPVGREQNRSVLPQIEDLDIWKALGSVDFISRYDLRRLQRQLGSLGGGNHFIELAADEADEVWLLIHSGSRFLGGLLRHSYNGRELELGSDEALQFFRRQETAIRFAALSRSEMARRVFEVLGESATDGERIDLVHNFVESRTTDAVHRKGACSAREGESGIIPGSMGSLSFIIEGRGSDASHTSSSHGAGRQFSRKEAFQRISSRDLFREMKGIVWGESPKLRDESPTAYKDIQKVMQSQNDLVRIRHRLRPLLSLKGED